MENKPLSGGVYLKPAPLYELAVLLFASSQRHILSWSSMCAGGRKGCFGPTKWYKSQNWPGFQIYKDGWGRGESGVGGMCVEMDGVSDSAV